MGTVHEFREIELEGKIWPLIPEGEYSIAYQHHDTKVVFSTPKVFVHFRARLANSISVGKFFHASKIILQMLLYRSKPGCDVYYFGIPTS